MKTLVIGLGNPLIADDSVGLKVIDHLRPQLLGRSDIEIDEDYWGGLRLMERMIDYDRAVVIDAICTGAEPGTIHLLEVTDIPTQKTNSAHDLTLRMALTVGRQAGAKLPEDDSIRLIGIEAKDVLTFDESCTPEVEAAIPHAVEKVLEVLESFTNDAKASN